MIELKFQTARTPHRCSECGDEIRAGVNYARMFSAEGRSRLCKRCFNLASAAILEGIEYPPGMLMETLEKKNFFQKRVHP